MRVFLEKKDVEDIREKEEQCLNASNTQTDKVWHRGRVALCKELIAKFGGDKSDGN